MVIFVKEETMTLAASILGLLAGIADLISIFV